MSQSTLPTLDNANLLGQGFDIFGPYTVDSLLKPLFDAGDKTHVIRVGQQDYLAPPYVSSFKILRSDSASEAGVTREEFQQSIAATANVNTSYGAFSGHMEMAFSRQVAHSSEYMFAYKSFYDGENELQLNPSVALAYRGKAFLEALETLPATVDMENLHLFADFFGTFGTHYTQKVRLGASMEFYVAVSKTSTDDAQEVGVMMHAHYNGLFVKGSLSSELTNSQEWKSYIATSRITVNVLGGSVEARGALSGIAEKDPSPATVNAFDQWVASINDNTSGVNFRLTPIWELCGDKSSVVRQAWMEFGTIMHPQLSITTWSPMSTKTPVVELSGKGQIVPEVPAQYNYGCMVAILDRANLLGPDSVKFAKYYSVRPSTWPETYLDMYNQVAKEIRASSFNNQNYALVFVTMGLDWNCVPSPDLAGLLLSAGAGQQLKNWINQATPGVRSNTNVNYILVSFFNQGEARGFEQLDHGKPYADVSSQLRVYFYRPSITGGLYTLGLSPFPTTVSLIPEHQARANTTRQVRSVRYLTHENKKPREEILAYWTPERMAQARPVPPPSPRGQKHPASEKHPSPVERPASAEPFEPGTLANYMTGRVPLGNLYDYPYQSVGKLFFTVITEDREKEDREASAAVVAENGLITAAHNLYDHELYAWAENIWFSPAYRKGDSKYGAWTYNNTFVIEEWEHSDDYEVILGYDVGFITLMPGGRTGDERIGKVVGQLPLLVDMNLDPDKKIRWEALGYPGVPPPDKSHAFDGEEMWVCYGDFEEERDNIVYKGGDFTYGSSGGPWLYQREKGSYSINGIESTGTKTNESTDSSPYFGTWVETFFYHCFPG